jgi:hypothetical protein
MMGVSIGDEIAVAAAIDKAIREDRAARVVIAEDRREVAYQAGYRNGLVAGRRSVLRRLRGLRSAIRVACKEIQPRKRKR